MRTKHQLIMDSTWDETARHLLKMDKHPWYIPNETKRYLIAECGSTCAICHQWTDNPHIDHRTPVKFGGTCCLDNLQVLCRFHNLSKSCHYLDPLSYKIGRVIPIVIKTEGQINRSILDKLEDEYA